MPCRVWSHGGHHIAKIVRRSAPEGERAPSCELHTVRQVDTEGDELRVLHGIRPEHWPRLRQIVLEVRRLRSGYAVAAEAAGNCPWVHTSPTADG